MRVDGDLLGQVAAGHRRGHLGDVADLGGQVAGHDVDVVGEVLPGAGHARAPRPGRRACPRCRPRGPPGSPRRRTDDSWSTIVLTVRLQLEHLARHVDRDLAGQVAVGHRGGHLGDVAHLVGQVAGHRVDRVGEVLPAARDARAPGPGRRACPRCRPRGPPG